jgi:hypothetical protein
LYSFYQKICIFLLFTLPLGIYSNEIIFLHAALEGEIKIRNSSISQKDLKYEFSKLASDIINQELLVSANALENTSENQKEICVTRRVHYVSKDYFYFPQNQMPSVTTSVYNCSSGNEIKKESLLKGYIYQSLNEHYKKVFHFIPSRSSINKNNFKAKESNVLFFIDASASLSNEKDELNQFISNEIQTKNWDLYSNLVSAGNYYTFTNSYISTVPFSKINSPEDLYIGYRKHLQSVKKFKELNIQFLFISPLQYTKKKEWITLINEARSKGILTYILIPYSSDHTYYQTIDTIAKTTNSKTLPITVWKKVGYIQGEEKYLVLHKGYLYTTSENPAKFESFNEMDKKRIQIDEKINPYNLNQLVEKYTNQKIIQESKYQSNMTLLLKNTMSVLNFPETVNSKRVLVRSNGQAIYIQVKPNTNLVKGETYILESNFILDSSNSWNIRNNVVRTKIHPISYRYPKLLEFNPSEIADYLKKYNLTELKAYLVITVEEVL